MTPELLQFIVAQCITAAATYAAIRSDLAALKVRAEHAERRLDRLEDRRAP